MRTKHKNGEEFYWLLYYAYLPAGAVKRWGDHWPASPVYPWHQPQNILPEAEGGCRGTQLGAVGIYLAG